MKKLIQIGLMLVFSLVATILATGEALAEPTELTVGLYPYVPRIEQFQTAIQTQWNKVHPEVSLKFLSGDEWDGGYDIAPPADVDVYVFDAINFNYFKSQNWLEPMQASEIRNLDDFVLYAIDGVRSGEEYYAIPQLGCANILFYERDDAALANATNLSDIEQTLGQCTYTSDIPPDRRGLMLDLAGGTTNATLYLDTVHSLNGEYPFPLPWSESELNREAIYNMQELLGMASYENATDSEPPYKTAYQLAEWFSDGWGRAVIGYTESMSAMSEETRQNIGFKVMPLSMEDESYPAVFYADTIAVNTTTEARGTRDLAVELANVMAATETMVASIGADEDNPYPQYLMATRASVFDTLQKSFPLYGNMYELIEDNDPIMFKLSDRSGEWLSEMKNAIKVDTRKDYPCGCDYAAIEQIFDNSVAPPICEATCFDYGGWNGQWTNEYPAAQFGSVCGCNACSYNQ